MMRRFLLALGACAALFVTTPSVKADWVLTITPDGWVHAYYDPSGGDEPPPPPNPGPWKLLYKLGLYWIFVY